jgi:hypothetical protein
VSHEEQNRFRSGTTPGTIAPIGSSDARTGRSNARPVDANAVDRTEREVPVRADRAERVELVERVLRAVPVRPGALGAEAPDVDVVVDDVIDDPAAAIPQIEQKPSSI